MIKLVLVDDEVNALKSLEWEIQNFSKDFEIIATFTNPEDAIPYIRKNEVDCVFVDIEMPQMDGLQFLRSFGCRDFLTVIVTAYTQYAIQAIKEEAMDYLLKPIDTEDLTMTLDKIKNKINQENQIRPVQVSGFNSKIPISTNGKILYVEPKNIIYCEGDGNYTKIFLKCGELIYVTKKIKEIQEILPEEIFFRVHNSYIINVETVKEFIKTDNYVVLENNKKIPVSRNKRNTFLDIF
ncbi:MAG: LytTR family DNA-binding domain-containing protein [Weeksellaceae bacterium]|nr:LytTR family DNA-binding domain-containing protein [Weeksellaceae bacterium]